MTIFLSIFFGLLLSLLLTFTSGNGSNNAKYSAIQDSRWHASAAILSARGDEVACGYLRDDNSNSLLISYGCTASVPLRSHQFRAWTEHHRERYFQQQNTQSASGGVYEENEMLISLQVHITLINIYTIFKKWLEVIKREGSQSIPPLEKVSLTLLVGIGNSGNFPVTVYPFAKDITNLQEILISTSNFADLSNDDKVWKPYEESIVFNVGWRVNGPVPSKDFALTIEPQPMDYGLLDTTLPMNDQVLFSFRNLSIFYVPPAEKIQLIHKDVRIVLSTGVEAVDPSSRAFNASRIRESCRLFGSPNAVILHKMKISNKALQDMNSQSLTHILKQRNFESTGTHDVDKSKASMASNTTIDDRIHPPLPRVLCGIFTIAKHHESHIKVNLLDL